jgi:hypothetical protein
MSGERFNYKDVVASALPVAGAVATGYLARDGLGQPAITALTFTAGSLALLWERIGSQRIQSRRDGFHQGHEAATDKLASLFNHVNLESRLHSFRGLYPDPEHPLYVSLDGSIKFTDPRTIALSIAKTPEAAIARVSEVIEQAEKRDLEHEEIEVLRKAMSLLSLAPDLAEYPLGDGSRLNAKLESIVNPYENQYYLGPVRKTQS